MDDDSRTKFELAERFLKAFGAMLDEDPHWAMATAIQVVSEAQALDRVKVEVLRPERLEAQPLKAG